ncbi:hypothetical protein JYU34_002402 [Plutella xylostella]|uniref:Tetraspanin n=1 Tax=Plutella xylostella TaxID=51655 RepID=A0ABQ7R229_PLUXY|nr:tetraspanin-7 [Plutella xylostella]KAG7311363.1 hypothetical protein JYU34_002402 [Plutella xylostella]
MGNDFQNVSGIACLKTFTFILNILFWLLGLALLLAGLWAEFELHKYLELSPELSGSVPHVLLGVAGLSLAVSSVAFSCIVKGQPVLLYAYSGFLGAISIMIAGVGMSLFCYRETFPKGLHDGLTQSVLTYDPDRNNIDFAQANMQCCGVSNYTDWVRLSPKRVIPFSCCVDPTHCVIANYSDVYQKGCYDTMLEYMDNNMNIIVGVALGTAMLPMIGTLVACSLAEAINKAKYDEIN